METGADVQMLAFEQDAEAGCWIGWAWAASWGCRRVRVEVSFRGDSMETRLIDVETGQVLDVQSRCEMVWMMMEALRLCGPMP